MEEDFDSGFFYHAVEEEFHVFFLVGAGGVGVGAAEGVHSFEEGREETGVGDGAFSSFSVGHEGEDETGGRHTAETAVLFDEDDLHSFSRRGYGGEGAGETAAGYYYVVVVFHGF